MKKTALITGASGGIGLEFARIFAKEGYNLILVARNEEKLTTLKNELEYSNGVICEILAKDLSAVGAAGDVFNFTVEKGIIVDVLVNNAGFGDYGDFASCHWEKQESMVHLNILALMGLTRLFISGMKERKSGGILNVASVASFFPGPLMSVYYASKAFVLSFTEALYVELKNSGITVSTLCPGPVATDFMERAEVGNSAAFSSLKAASAKDVAEYGYQKFKENKVIAIPGLMNRIGIIMAKFMPRCFVRNMVYKVQKVRDEKS